MPEEERIKLKGDILAEVENWAKDPEFMGEKEKISSAIERAEKYNDWNEVLTLFKDSREKLAAALKTEKDTKTRIELVRHIGVLTETIEKIEKELK